jgi:hypothetical protein
VLPLGIDFPFFDMESLSFGTRCSSLVKYM